MWALEWEQSTGRNQVEVVSEAAAAAQAHELVVGRGISRVVYFEIATEGDA